MTEFLKLPALLVVAFLFAAAPLAAHADATAQGGRARIASESKRADREAKRAERAAARAAKKKERAERAELAKAKTGKRRSGDSENKPDLGGDDPLEGL